MDILVLSEFPCPGIVGICHTSKGGLGLMIVKDLVLKLTLEMTEM